MKKSINVGIIGAGGRGDGFGRLIRDTIGLGEVVAVHRCLRAISENNPSLILASAQESLRTHSIVFAAEQSQRTKRMVDISELGGVLPSGVTEDGEARHDNHTTDECSKR
jgi:hypothetical protein